MANYGTFTYSHTFSPQPEFYQVSGLLFRKEPRAKYLDPYNTDNRFLMFGPNSRYDEPKVHSIIVVTEYTKWGEQATTQVTFSTPPDQVYKASEITISVPNADPLRPFKIVSISLQIDVTGSGGATPDIDFAVQGTASVAFTGDNLVANSINQYSILIGAAAGPIEKVHSIRVGSTEVWNSIGETEGLPNVATGWTPGIDNSQIQYNFALPTSSVIDYENVDIASGAHTTAGKVAVQLTDQADLAYISNYTDLQLHDLFSKIHYTFSLSGAVALDYRSTTYAIHIPLDALQEGTADIDFYPTDLQLVLNFPAGLYDINEKDGKVKTSSFNMALVYTDENKNQITTETSNIVRVVNLAGYAIDPGSENATNWVSQADNAGDLNYHRFKISSQSKAGLRIPIVIDQVPPNARYLKIWRILDDAYGQAPPDGYPDPTADPISSGYQVSFCELSKYQLGYKKVALTYAGTALIGVLTTANSGLNNYYPAITSILYGRVVDWIPVCRPDESSENLMQVFSQDYTGTTEWDEALYGTLNNTYWKTGFTTNPVWCLLDLLLDREDALGNYIDVDSLDLESFFIAAKWCDERIKYGELWANTTGDIKTKISDEYLPRYSLNMTVEMNMPVSAVIQAILLSFRGLLFWRDGTYVLKVDKQDNITQILNDTQLTDIALNVTSLQKLPNAFTFTFNDIEKDLTQTSLYIEDYPTIVASDGQVKSKAVTLAGINNKYQATSIAKYHMYTNRNVNKNMTFTASLDLLTADVWDVVRVHTQKFLNKATYSAKIDSIVANGTEGLSRYTITTKTPIMLYDGDNGGNGVTHRWSIQSYYGGSINLFQGDAFSTSVAVDTEYFTFDILSTDGALHTKLQENDTFTVIGNSDSYYDWRIVGMKVNSTKNTVQVLCTNYVDSYYADLDNYEIAKDWAVRENVNQIKLSSNFDINSEINPLSVKFSAEPIFDELNRILKVDLLISIPNLADNLEDFYTIVLYGGRNEAPLRLLQSFLYPSETTFRLNGIDLGNWEFQFNIADKYGKTHISRIISKVIDSSLFFEDTEIGGGVQDPVTRSALVPTVYNFTDEYIRIKWEDIPTIITAIDIEFTDGIDSAVRSYQVVPDSNGDFQIEQLVYDLTEITNNKNTTFYSLYIGYWDAFGGYWPAIENKDQSLYLVSNPPPITPYAGLFYYKQSYHTITVYPVQSNIRNYITTVNDFAGFTIFIGADAVSDADFSFSDPSTYVGIDNPLLGTITFSGTILVSQQVDYDPDTEAVGITVFDLYEFMGTNNSLTINIWVMATDIFGQTSQPFNLGQTQIYKVENVVNTELIPAAIGDTLSTNLLKNSSFEGWTE